MSISFDAIGHRECVSCRLNAGQIAATRVFEDAMTLAFMGLGQVNPGHVLVA